MPRIDDPNIDGAMRGLRRPGRMLAAANPLEAASIDRGALTVQSTEGLVVKGTAKITGQLNGNGSINWTGPINATGNVNVTGGGKVNVGSSMVLDPSVSSGAIVFSNGAQVFTDSTTIQVYKGSSAVTVASNSVTISNGSYTVVCDSGGVKMFGLPTKSGTGLLAGLLWRDNSTGAISRIV